MTEQARKQRNTDRLAELYPIYRAGVTKVIAEMEKRGYRPRIQDGYRSPADQLKAFNSGNSKLKYGFHNVTGANGAKESLAVDLLDDDSPLASRKEYLLNLADVCRSLNLLTGIKWGLPAALGAAVDAAIKNKDWKANVKIGWDPTHIEPTGITVAEAKAGKRP